MQQNITDPVCKCQNSKYLLNEVIHLTFTHLPDMEISSHKDIHFVHVADCYT